MEWAKTESHARFNLAASGVEAHLHSRSPVVPIEQHLCVMRPRRDPLEPLEQYPRPRAQLIGDLAVARRDGDAHGQPP